MTRRKNDEGEEIITDDGEVNVTQELDYDIPEADFTVYEEEEQVITEDAPADIPIHLIKLGEKIKRVQRIPIKKPKPRGRPKKKTQNTIPDREINIDDILRPDE